MSLATAVQEAAQDILRDVLAPELVDKLAQQIAERTATRIEPLVNELFGVEGANKRRTPKARRDRAGEPEADAQADARSEGEVAA